MNVVKCGAFLTMLYRLMPESLVAVLAISALDTAVTTLIIGPPLRVFTFSRIEAEADLRAALMRAQQYAEEIVLFRGGDRELARCQRQLDGILGIQRSRRDCPAASPAARRAAGARASACAGSLCRNNAQSSSGCSASSPAGRRRRRRPSLAGPCCPSGSMTGAPSRIIITAARIFAACCWACQNMMRGLTFLLVLSAASAAEVIKDKDEVRRNSLPLDSRGAPSLSRRAAPPGLSP